MSDETATCFIIVRRKYCESGRVVRKYRRDGGGWTEQRRFAWATLDRALADRFAAALKYGCRVEECFVNTKPLAKFGDPMEPAVLGRARKRKS